MREVFLGDVVGVGDVMGCDEGAVGEPLEEGGTDS